MEKIICPACGAPLNPDTSKPLLTCDYCDTAVENKFYVAPAVPEPVAQEPTAVEEEPVIVEEAAEETSSGGGLVKTLLGIGTAIAANRLRRNTVVRRPTVVHSPLRANRASTPHRHPEPPRAGGFGPRPARPAQRSSVRGGMAGRPTHPGGGRGPSGRGGMGGPGGRHR